jgi:hypothetical protein
MTAQKRLSERSNHAMANETVSLFRLVKVESICVEAFIVGR